MTNKTTKPSRRKTRYRPSDEEIARSEQLLTKLSPSPSAYQEYRLRVDSYLNLIRPLLRGTQREIAQGVGLRRSALFPGLRYMVVYVDDPWLRETAPGCDAIASPMTGLEEQDGMASQLPPLVYIPQSKRRARSNAFRSVVEHEFVHINQVLAGAFPELPADCRAEDIFEYLLSYTAAEYEACYVQLARWPDTYPVDAGLSLEHWCRLRGYTQALEHVLFGLVDLDVSPDEVRRLVALLQSSLSEGFIRIGATAELAEWFQERLTEHMLIAVQQVMTMYPSVKEHSAFRAVGLWLKENLGGLI